MLPCATGGELPLVDGRYRLPQQCRSGNVAVKYKLADDAVALVLQTAVRHVFESNFRCGIEEIGAVSRDDLSLTVAAGITSYFVRIYGDFNAILCMQMPRELISHVARESLGWETFQEETFAGDGILRDASGEMVNMIAGTFKNMLSRVGIRCRLLPPESFNTDSDLVLRVLSAENSWMAHLRVGGMLTQVILLSVRD